jgi:hypothetical protein
VPENLVKAVRLSEKALWKRFHKACEQNNLECAIGLLYQWFDNHGGAQANTSIRASLTTINQPELIAAYRQLMQSLYLNRGGGTDHPRPDHSCSHDQRIDKDGIEKNCADIRKFARQYARELNRQKSILPFSRHAVELNLN